MTYEEAKKLAIEVSKTNSNDCVYILNIGKEYDIARDLMEFMMKNQFGYEIIERINCQNQENFVKIKRR